MSLVIAGQLAGIAFACGLDLYITVAALGILSRTGLVALPPGLQGLEGGIVIATALALYLVEAVVDKIHHADSLWDALHTFIRPPAAALLAVGALWAQPNRVIVLGAALAFVVALAAHAAKAGLRMTLNATLNTGWQSWISVAEDALAVALAVVALLYPVHTFIGVAATLVLGALVGPRLWRAFRLGVRSVVAWLRSIFRPGRWREIDELPRAARRMLDGTPLGMAPPQAARATLHGLPGAGAFRNGWLVASVHGLRFFYRTPFGNRLVELPAPREIRHDGGVWADILHITGEEDAEYIIFLLKDGPKIDLAIQHMSPATV